MWRRLGLRSSRPRPTQHPPNPEQGLIKKAASIPGIFPTRPSTARTCPWPPLLAKALPTRPSGTGPPPEVRALRATYQTFVEPRVLALPPGPSPLLPQGPSTPVPPRGPSPLTHRVPLIARLPHRRAEPPAPHPFPVPAPGTAPAPPPRPRRRVLPGGDCRSPSAIFFLPGAGPDACSLLTFHPRAHPSFPRAQIFLKRNEHRPAITENLELKSPGRRRPPCRCGALREHAQQRPARGRSVHGGAAAMLVRGPRRMRTNGPPTRRRALGTRQPCFCGAGEGLFFFFFFFCAAMLLRGALHLSSLCVALSLS